MTEETMNAVSILISRTVMVKRKRATTVPSEEERRGKTRRSGTDNNAIVQVFQTLDPGSAALDQPVES